MKILFWTSILILWINGISAQKQTFSDGLSIICTCDYSKHIKKKISKYNWIGSENGKMIGYVNRRCNVTDSMGKVIISGEFNHINRIRDIFKVYKDKKYYLFDKTGDCLTSTGYNYINTESSENAIKVVDNNNKWGILDFKGNQIIPCIYDYVKENNHVYIVTQEKKWGVLDRSGHIFIPIEYEFIDFFSNNMYKATKNGYMGLINHNNNTIVDFKYVNISFENSNLGKACECDEFFTINSFGKIKRYEKKGFQLVDPYRLMMCKNPRYKLLEF